MERDINGMPRVSTGGGIGCSSNEDASLGSRPLAYAYVPIQSFRMLYSPEEALKHATLFEELYKPMEVYGRE